MSWRTFAALLAALSVHTVDAANSDSGTVKSGIGDGNENTVSGDYSWIGGGYGNSAGSNAFIFVGGGYSNLASGYFSSVVGGMQNTASGTYAAVGGGLTNTASGDYSSVPGGLLNVASGVTSVAMGQNAQATHDFAGVFGFLSSGSCESVGSGSMTVCVDSSLVVNGMDIVAVIEANADNITALEADVTAVKNGLDALGVWVDNVTEELAATANASVGLLRADLIKFQANTSANFKAISAKVWAGFNETSSRLDFLDTQNAMHVNGTQVLRDSVTSFEALVAAVNESVVQLRTVDFAKLDSNLTDLSTSLFQTRHDVALVHSVAANASSVVEELIGTTLHLEQNASVQQQQLSSLFETLDTHATKAANLDTTVANLTRDNHVVANSVATLEEMVVNQSSTIQHLDQNASVQQQQLSSLFETLDTHATKAANLDTTVANLTRDNHVVANSVATLEEMVVNQSSTIQHLELANTQLAEDVAVLNATNTALQAANSDLQAQLLAFNETIVTLVNTVASLVEGAAFAAVDDDCTSDVELTVECVENEIPLLESVAIADTTGSLAMPLLVNEVTVEVNASAGSRGGGELEFTYSVVAPSLGWSYEVAKSTSPSGDTDVVTFAAARSSEETDTYVHVDVADMSTGESVSCALPGFSATLEPSNGTRIANVTCPVVVLSSHSSTGSMSSVAAAVAEAMKANFSATNASSSGGAMVFLGALGAIADVSGAGSEEGDGLVTLVAQAFTAYLNDGFNETTFVDQDAIVLSALVAAASNDLADSDEDHTVLSALLEQALTLVGHSLPVSQPSQGTLQTYLEAMSSFGEYIDAMVSLSDLDHALDSVCMAAAQASGSGSATTYGSSTFTLSCSSTASSTPTTAVVATESLTLVGNFGGTNGSATVSISTWNVSEGNNTALLANTELLADVQGITITTADGQPPPQAEDVDDGYQLAIAVSTGTNSSVESELGLRRRLSCRYWDERNVAWSSRGVFLRGVEVWVKDPAANGLGASAICVSTHLTLFTVTDEGQAAKVVESKIQGVAARFEAMSEVDFLNADTELNPFVPAVFVGVTLLFAITVVVAKVSGRHAAVDDARLVFVQFGALKRPAVLGADEQMAILRGWLSAGQVAGLVFLQVLTVNPFIALFFRWSHERIVFTQADKAFILYSGVVSTFLVQAFYFDADTQAAAVAVNATVDNHLANFSTTMFNVFLGAMFASVLLFPVQYFLPYMISNVNSFTTSTAHRVSIVQSQMQALSSKLCRKSQKARRLEKQHAALQRDLDRSVRILQLWEDQVHETKLRTIVGDEKLRRRAAVNHSDPARRKVGRLRSLRGAPAPPVIEQALSFFNIRVKLPTYRQLRGGEHLDSVIEETNVKAAFKEVVLNNAAANGIARCQLRVRDKQQRRRALRLLEFDHWLQDCKQDRGVLAIINAAFVTILSVFTMVVCLLLSAAFTEQQCFAWAAAVGQSVLMQVLVTHPLLGFIVQSFRLISSAVLLRVKTRKQAHQKKLELEQRATALAVRHAHLNSELLALEATQAAAMKAGASCDAEQARKAELLARLHHVEDAEALLAEEQRQFALERTISDLDEAFDSDDDNDDDIGNAGQDTFHKQSARAPAIAKSVLALRIGQRRKNKKKKTSIEKQRTTVPKAPGVELVYLKSIRNHGHGMRVGDATGVAKTQRDLSRRPISMHAPSSTAHLPSKLRPTAVVPDNGHADDSLPVAAVVVADKQGSGHGGCSSAARQTMRVAPEGSSASVKIVSLGPRKGRRRNSSSVQPVNGLALEHGVERVNNDVVVKRYDRISPHAHIESDHNERRSGDTRASDDSSAGQHSAEHVSTDFVSHVSMGPSEGRLEARRRMRRNVRLRSPTVKSVVVLHDATAQPSFSQDRTRNEIQHKSRPVPLEATAAVSASQPRVNARRESAIQEI
eukprot:INCI16312.9.p1 GENE.INCI16312.9~~INCI16312.9.p1  ORF type:complete len:1916 (+),score=402.72 INCI16312.9:439-6186(+)